MKHKNTETKSMSIAMKASNSSSNVHPPYLQMIIEAIPKDQNGLSQPTIAKFIKAKYKQFLPPNFKKFLFV
uniref:H15 domain-containing protein n=1 Tax=Solanum lycopersicum TaxID=4081 RepID=A0A3Q7GNX1_SOLLC